MAWRRPGDTPLSKPMVYWPIYASFGVNELITTYLELKHYLITIQCMQNHANSRPSCADIHQYIIQWLVKYTRHMLSSSWHTISMCRDSDITWALSQNHRQATGLDAYASRVKCPARFVSHLHEIFIYIYELFIAFVCFVVCSLL